MPTYEYRCTVCSHEFEEFQGINDAPLKKCPKCGKKVQRLFGTGSGIMFKGSGFYQTDYKKTSPASSEKKEAPKAAPKTGKTSTNGNGK